MIEIRRIRPDAPQAAGALRDYLTDIVSRYHERPATDAEVDAVIARSPHAEFAAPTGAFLLALEGDELLGCAGVRLLEPGVSEIKRMFVYPHARRRGVASRLLAAAEDAGRELGATLMRMDTRKDLIEARAMYPRYGYKEIAAYNDDVYADHWYEKPL